MNQKEIFAEIYDSKEELEKIAKKRKVVIFYDIKMISEKGDSGEYQKFYRSNQILSEGIMTTDFKEAKNSVFQTKKGQTELAIHSHTNFEK